MNLTSEQLRRIIQEELRSVLKEKQQLDEISLKQFIVGLLIAKAGMAPSTAAAEVDSWDVSNEIVNVMQQGQINKQDINKAVFTSKSIQKQTGGPQNISVSGKEITAGQCIASIESALIQVKEINGYEGEINIKCNDGIDVSFVYSKVRDNVKNKTKEIATLTVKAPNNPDIEGTFTGKEALQKSKIAIKYAKQQHPEIQKGISNYKTAKQLKQTGI